MDESKPLPDYFKSVQILALRDVTKGTSGYYERYVMRWFAKNYSTPYHVVKEMEFEEVLQAFYEEQYASYDEEKLELEKRDLLETSAERSARLTAEELEEQSLAQLVADSESQNKKMEHVVKKAEPAPVKELKESAIPDGLQDLIKPDVQMSFMSEEDLEKLIASIDAQGGPKKPQS